jgi:signal transduction histidine kinase
VKVRTKLILLLSSALVAIMVPATLLRIRLTGTSLEDQVRKAANDTAEVIARELSQRLTPNMDDDDIAEEVQKVKLRHPIVSLLELTWDSDEDTTKTFSLPPETEETVVRKKTRMPRLSANEVRRVLYDHGETGRAPGGRAVEPLWWTPEKPSPDRWTAVATPPKRTQRAPLSVGTRGGRTVFTARLAVDPSGPARGSVAVTVNSEPFDQVDRVEVTWSLFITGGALLILLVLTTLIVNRVVGRPVGELEAAMKRVEGGELDARVEAKRSDEIGALSKGFNRMVEQLAAADSEIRAFNRRLADEVQAATEDLARKNAALGQLNRLFVEARRQLGDKERLAALGQLAAQLAHEIGTPLASVSGHLQLALVGRDLPVVLKERLQVATSELQRISKIVRDYLDSTRAVQPERVLVDAERLVDEAIGIVQGDEQRAAVTMRLQPSEKLAELHTDPGLMRQILVNLLTNAADAVLQAGGSGAVEVSLQANGNVAAIVVRDEGVGIGADDAARIFEPFYTTKGRGKGTGLGLAICRELALAMGGRISVESSPGHGSRFTVSLPLGAPIPVAEKATA